MRVGTGYGCVLAFNRGNAGVRAYPVSARVVRLVEEKPIVWVPGRAKTISRTAAMISQWIGLSEPIYILHTLVGPLASERRIEARRLGGT